MGSGLIPEIALEATYALVATIVGITVPYIAYKLRQVEVLKITLMGVDGVESMDGVVGTLELLDGEVEANTKDIAGVNRKLSNVESKVETNGNKLSDLEKMIQENAEEIEERETELEQLMSRVESLSQRIKERSDKRNSSNNE